MLHTICKQRWNTDKMKVLPDHWKFAKHDENHATHYLVVVNSFHINCSHKNFFWVCLKPVTHYDGNGVSQKNWVSQTKWKYDYTLFVFINSFSQK